MTKRKNKSSKEQGEEKIRLKRTKKTKYNKENKEEPYSLPHLHAFAVLDVHVAPILFCTSCLRAILKTPLLVQLSYSRGKSNVLAFHRGDGKLNKFFRRGFSTPGSKTCSWNVVQPPTLNTRFAVAARVITTTCLKRVAVFLASTVSFG